jgi:acetyl-CoA carboxylase carboxyltransferase component
VRGALLRLHGAGRHAGRARPPQEGPAVRADRADAAADVFFAEGGGGRPGDTDYPVVSALDTRAFALWARLSGLVPRIAVVKGRCFAGNAVIAGCSDLIVATEDARSAWAGRR